MQPNLHEITTALGRQVTYAVEARDGNLRLTVLGTLLKANRQIPGDAQLQRFSRDLAEVAKSVIGTFGSR
jgi:hypothetical protein